MENQIQKAIAQILAICYQINEKTEFAAFYYFSGHTKQIDVYISKNKTDEFNTRVSNRKVIYLDHEDSLNQLTALTAKLLLFLEDQTAPKEEKLLIEL